MIDSENSAGGDRALDRARAFLRRLTDDLALQRRLTEVLRQSPEAASETDPVPDLKTAIERIVGVAAEHGFELDPEAWRQVVEARVEEGFAPPPADGTEQMALAFEPWQEAPQTCVGFYRGVAGTCVEGGGRICFLPALPPEPGSR